MDYLIAVLQDRLQAEEAYTALEKEGIPTPQMAILGRGYKSLEEFGFREPQSQAKQQAMLMAVWLVPFGFIAGYVFNVQTHIEIIPALGALGNHILGGIFGAMGGAMGSFFIGGGVGLSSSEDELTSYRDRLDRGDYLVILRGSELLQQKARPILRRFNPTQLSVISDRNP